MVHRQQARDPYTLLAIYDTSTNKYIPDSIEMARYLDEMYPDTPKLILQGTRAAIELFQTLFFQSVDNNHLSLVIAQTNALLDERGGEYSYRTREVTYEGKLEEITPAVPKREHCGTTLKKD